MTKSVRYDLNGAPERVGSIPKLIPRNSVNSSYFDIGVIGLLVLGYDKDGPDRTQIYQTRINYMRYIISMRPFLQAQKSAVPPSSLPTESISAFNLISKSTILMFYMVKIDHIFSI